MSSRNIALRNASFFLHHLNNMKTTIKFGMEKKEDGAIPFLDVLGGNITEDDSI
jgi:hypothetical protein